MKQARPLFHTVASFAVVAGLGFLVASNRSDIGVAGQALRSVDLTWFVGSLALAACWSVNQSALHAAAQRASGADVRVRDLLPVSLAGNFLNLVAKSGGMAGLAVFVADGRRRGRARGAIVAAYMLVVVVGELAFAATLAVAIVVVSIDGHLTRGELVASAVFAVYLMARLTLVAAAARSRESVRRIYAIPRRWIAQVRRREAPVDEDQNESADELFEAITMLRTVPRAVGPVFLHALLVEVIGVAMLWTVLHSLGQHLAWSVAFVAYAVSVLFTIVGILPGGVGFVEVSMGALLVSFGMTAGAAAATVVLYRVLELWLPLLVGAASAIYLRRMEPAT